MAPKQKHQQNQYGLSYPGMIVVAIRNSPVLIKSAFCERAMSTKDIYKFLRSHVKPIAAMNAKTWERTERVIRHSLSQTKYFHRYQIDEEGVGKIVPSKTAGADKGGLWTLHPFNGESEAAARKTIAKVFKKERVEQFKTQLKNPCLLGELLEGSWGWKNPAGEPLGASDASEKLLKQQEENGFASGAGVYVAPEGVVSSKPKRSRKRKESDSDEDSDLEDEDEEQVVQPWKTYNLRPRKQPEEPKKAPMKPMMREPEPEPIQEEDPFEKMIYEYYGFAPQEFSTPSELELPEGYEYYGDIPLEHRC
ncbi:hypothetical protein L596_023509 [Steinernema carpocapsae]|uniref:Fork-head domain-containing protein n=1 Tax=Steinernema carpocapsae TaxID=34508 RepID=A0A4U5MDX2_STECR|nr:hypothetical protein L596_023509 [Steinernema carpocapsae]